MYTDMIDPAPDGILQVVDGALLCNGADVTSNILNCWTPIPAYQPVWPTQTIVFSGYPQAPGKFEQAFRVVSKLLEKGIVEDITVKRFIALVNEIAEIL